MFDDLWFAGWEMILLSPVNPALYNIVLRNVNQLIS